MPKRKRIKFNILLFGKTVKRLLMQLRHPALTLRCVCCACSKRRHPADFTHYLSVVATIKNEAPYIAEWIEHHLLLGVTKFYIYDNDSEDNLHEVLSPYIRDNIVEYIKWPGKYQQNIIYQHSLIKARKETFWLAVIDIDEFLRPLGNETMPDLLRIYERFPGIAVNWAIYGSSGLKKKTQGLVIERFKHRAEFSFDSNKFIKSIINPRRTVLNRTHAAVYLGLGQEVDTDGIPLEKYYRQREGKFDRIVLNHYYGKSLEEFMEKKQRGSTVNYVFYPVKQFNDYDRNDVYDDGMDQFIPQIYKNLTTRQNRTTGMPPE